MMNSRFKAVMLALAAFGAFSAPAEKVYLWPEGLMPDAQPGQIAAMTDVSTAPGFNSDEWRTAEARMARKGFQAAAKKITKEYARMLRENEKGVIKYDPRRSS